MGNVVESLQALNIAADDFVYLNYEDRMEVWHISDDYVQNALDETETAAMLARLLVTSGIKVYSRYEDDILTDMRDNGLLDNYDHEDWFEDYLTETIQAYAYEWDLLTISTQRHDHKRGTCEISANVKVRAGELYELRSEADFFVSGFDIVVQTPSGLLTLTA